MSSKLAVIAAICVGLTACTRSEPTPAPRLDAGAATPPPPDPMAPCETCFTKVCGPCRSPDCVPEWKVDACRLVTGALRTALAEKTAPDKEAHCRRTLENCEKIVAEAEQYARLPTPEDRPLDFVQYRIETAGKVHTDAGALRKALLCEMAAMLKLHDDVTVGMLETRPDRYRGRPIRFHGRIFQVVEDESSRTTQLLIDPLGGSNPIHVVYPATTDVLVQQQVLVFGIVSGTYSYTSVAGYALTVPEVVAMTLGERRRMLEAEISGRCPPDDAAGGVVPPR